MAQSSFEAWKDAPICLSGSAIGLAASVSGTANTGRLQNKYRAPVVIESLEFLNTFTNPSSQAWRWGAQVKLQAGSYEITRNYVPIYALAPAAHGEYTTGNAAQMQELTPDVSGITYDGSTSRNLNYVHWKLPRPLYMSPGMSLTAEFLRGDALAGTINFNLAARGYSLKGAPRPDMIDVPYVSSFTGSPTTAAQQTQQLQLDNRFKKPLYVQRLVGRMENGNALTMSLPSTAGFATTGVKVLIRTYGGESIVKDFTSFFQVFPVRWAVLNINEEIPQNEGFVVDIQGVNTADISVASRPVLSLVGCRKERTL